MTINPQVERMDNGGWRFSWSPTSPPYAVWLDGLLIATVEDETVEISRPNYSNSPPDVEIVDSDSGSESQSETYPPYMVLQWRGIQTAAGYVVEKLVGVSWVVQQTIREAGKGYYSWRTPALPDGEESQYRVKAVDLRGNAGAALSFSFEVVRNPAHPEVSIETDSGGDVVVSEA